MPSLQINQEIMMNYYSKIAGSYDKLYEEEQINKLKLISKYIKVKENDLLLDIGCGTGISTRFFKCKAIGIDNSKGMLKKAGKNCVFGDAGSLPFKDNMFDIVISVTAMHNFKDAEMSINEIKRVSKNNSKIAVTLLKKSKKFLNISGLLLKNFDFIEVEEEKDIIFIRE